MKLHIFTRPKKHRIAIKTHHNSIKMTKYNPYIHNRRSLRLKKYDYSKEGLYFITICVKYKECFFGKITNGKMTLTDTGKIANDYWFDIPKHFPNIALHEFVVMPNHIHGIIEIMEKSDNKISIDANVGACHGVPLNGIYDNISHNVPQYTQFGKPIIDSISLIVNQYKSSVKRWCNINDYQYFQWQRNYYEHIIRDESSHQDISKYIINNPAKWVDDKFYYIE